MADGIPAVVGGDLVEGVGNEGHLGGFYVQDQVDEFLLLGIAFDIELGGNDLFDGVDIAIADMPFVGPGMDGNAVCAEFLRVYGGFNNIGIIPATAVAEGGEFIDVNGKLGHAAKIEKRPQGSAKKKEAWVGLWDGATGAYN